MGLPAQEPGRTRLIWPERLGLSREHSALPTSNSQLCTFGSHSITDSHYCAAPHSQTHCSVGKMGLRKENRCLFTQLGCEGPHTVLEGLASIPTDRLSPVDREYMAHTGTGSAHFQSFKHVYLPNTSLQLQLPHKERGLQQPKAHSYPGIQGHIRLHKK